MIKKFLSVFCTVAMLMMALPAYAQSDIVCVLEKPTGGKIDLVEGYLDDEAFCFFEVRYSAAAEESTLFDTLEEGLMEHQLLINISSHRIPATAEGEKIVSDTICDVVYGNYEIICSTSFIYYHNGEIITRIKPNYILDSKEADEAARIEMDAKIDMYLGIAAEVPDFLGKMLVIHDEMARRCRYSTAELAEYNRKAAILEAWNKAYNNGENPDPIAQEDELTTNDYSIFTAYRLLVKDNAVCQGNAIALNAIYERLAEVCGRTDFETAYCYNSEHVWNLIKLNGEWYHLDETWNDPDVKVSVGDDVILSDRCVHEYFMVSDRKMQDHSPEEWGYYCYDGDTIACDDTEYESGYIFSGENEYGPWYGNVSYQNGRYAVDVWVYKYNSATSSEEFMGYPMFYSQTVKSYGLIASDIVIEESNGAITNKVLLFANENIEAGINKIYALYDGDTFQKIEENSTLGAVGECNHLILRFTPASNEGKVFLWKNGTQEPLCEAMQIK